MSAEISRGDIDGLINLRAAVTLVLAREGKFEPSARIDLRQEPDFTDCPWQCPTACGMARLPGCALDNGERGLGACTESLRRVVPSRALESGRWRVARRSRMHEALAVVVMRVVRHICGHVPAVLDQVALVVGARKVGPHAIAVVERVHRNLVAKADLKHPNGLVHA